VIEDLALYFGTTGKAVLDPLLVLFNSFILFLPGLIAAIVIVIVGYLVAALVGYLIKRLLDKVKLDAWMKKHHLDDSIGHLSLSYLLSKLIKWYIVIAFLIPAIAMLQMGTLSSLLRNFVMWLPHVISAVLIFIFGLILADFAEHRITEAKGKFAKTLGAFVKVIVVVFVTLVALQELGIYLRIAENTLMVLITGITLAVSIAVGIGLGYGLKKNGDQLVKKMQKKWL